jgi:NDP-sugar pyrophosphorylase family protein
LKNLPAINAAILAGGLGTRLRSVAPETPKVMVEVKGRPFLCHILDKLVAAGVTTTVLCIGYKGDEVRKVMGSRYGNMSLRYSQEKTLLGTAGALRLALPLFTTENVLVLNGDTYCDVDLEDFAAWHLGHQAEATLLIGRCQDTAGYGRVMLDSDGRLRNFLEKAQTPGPGLVNAGVYLITRKLLQLIPTGRVVSLERDFLPGQLEKGIYGYVTEAPFIDIGTPDNYAQANSFIK